MGSESDTAVVIQWPVFVLNISILLVHYDLSIYIMIYNLLKKYIYIKTYHPECVGV